ncbi:amidase [Kineococcus rhizosphaerae]|uniref:Aspartyl-tRNA(Asn)/glutamyl-tRNA(Gln) amidotransferase subunit A n=1 Tax=Kineococcus rhizosphaerae TaxID=559628 RepID=A0A2T0R738_9ACTN|nr:amidase [Kineococcus rhizosphaerae]PRY16976.1 aspartyl-tRNA(Asn)/glutamyl-tRNA(Gln) amidotransferase subunit A [Kineococcus rhizosphaerae]
MTTPSGPSSDALPDPVADEEFDELLSRHRSRPHAPSPSAQAPEPWDGTTFLERFPRPVPRRGTPPAPRPDASRVPGVAELLAGYADGALDPVTVVEEVLAAVGPDGPAPTAFLAECAGAREAAADSARRWAGGRARPLEGVPFGVKDIVDVAGTPVTCGSLLTGDRVAATDAVVVARLRAAGAVPVVMTATTEFACGLALNARYGAVQNPWRAGRWTGGSSTGSGAAVAARVVPFALGTDTGGSVRVPSSLCGISGLKPTYGLLPRDGVSALSWTLDHVGPMARSALDLALVLAVLADAPVQVCADLQGVRVGRVRGWFEQRCDAGVVAATDETVRVLRAHGAEVVDVDLPGAARAYDDGLVVLSAELAATQEGNADRAGLFDGGTRKRLGRGARVSAADYLRALRGRALAQRELLDVMDRADVDVLLTPGVGTTAPHLDDLTADVDDERVPLQEIVPRNTSPFNVTGFPALVVPAGTGRDDLPVAVQLVARPYAEDLLLGVGAGLQAVTDHHLAAPAGRGATVPA